MEDCVQIQIDYILTVVVMKPHCSQESKYVVPPPENLPMVEKERKRSIFAVEKQMVLLCLQLAQLY